ncbi:methyl-accepting chemotaxis protein [Rhizobium sp. CG5]|uniref:methyl-accepting chemotaxis protein n=1 Tax=Rhizobium sp. CG5 TaxID=2726076 RepID=UPI0020349D3F|nr:methyl-accepting chemotaxis protein [Rhizobium sp. CG5]
MFAFLCGMALVVLVSFSFTADSTLMLVFAGMVLAVSAAAHLAGAGNALKTGSRGTGPLTGRSPQDPGCEIAIESVELPSDEAPANDNIVSLDDERQLRIQAQQPATLPHDFVVSQLGEYPTYVELLTLQLQSVSQVSQQAAEKLMTSLLDVDQRVTVLTAFLQKAGSDDSSEQILGRIEHQLSACRQHLSHLSDQQEREASEAIAFQDKLSDETQSVLAVLNGVQRIARQTTMLSLNVSIEAGRVGEVGKGFAVIAQEIRSLAGEVRLMADDVHERVSGLMSSVHMDLKEQARRRQHNEAAAMGNVSEGLGILKANLTLLLEHQREVLGRITCEATVTNENIAQPITSMMGSIQFQDIVRQQIEQVIDMAEKVKTHLDSVRAALQNPAGYEGVELIGEVLGRLFSTYVMREQRQIHGTLLGHVSASEEPVASIELF